MAIITKNSEGFMQSRISDCIVNYNNDIYDKNCAISSVYYRFKDENGHTFPVDMTESTYKFIAERIKYLVINKMPYVKPNYGFGKNHKHLRIKVIGCNSTLPTHYNDKNFYIVVFNEQTRTEVKLPLSMKDRVTHPGKLNYQNELNSIRNGKKHNHTTSVNNLSKTITQTPTSCIQNGNVIPLKNEVNETVPTPVSVKTESVSNSTRLDEFREKVLNIKKEYVDDLEFEILEHEEEIENCRKEIDKINQQISQKEKKIEEIKEVLKTIELVEISMTQR